MKAVQVDNRIPHPCHICVIEMNSKLLLEILPLKLYPLFCKMALTQVATVKSHETSPLLPRESPESPIKYGKSVLYRALLAGFMISLSFGVTQVPYEFPTIFKTFPSHFF